MKKICGLLLFLSVSLAGLCQENFDSVKVVSLKLTSKIYMLTGSGGNIGVMTGADGILVVDDQFAPLTEKIKAEIKSLDPGSVRFVVNTHIHGDHAGGNANFKKAGATIIAHDNVRTHMINDKEPVAKDNWPVVTFSTSTTLHLDDEDIHVLYFGSGHTDGDVLIHFTKANVFHAGDLYVRYGYPYIDYTGGGSMKGFVNNLDKMLLLMDDNSKIIPGHGEIATKKDVQIFRDKMKDIYDQVAAAIKKGTKKENLSALGITKKYDADWGKGFIKGNDFVAMIADELAVKK